MSVLINDSAYGSERAFNAPRLAKMRRRQGSRVPAGRRRVLRRGGQIVPNGYYHLDRMLTGAAARATLNRTGAVPVEESTRPGMDISTASPGRKKAIQRVAERLGEPVAQFVAESSSPQPNVPVRFSGRLYPCALGGARPCGSVVAAASRPARRTRRSPTAAPRYRCPSTYSVTPSARALRPLLPPTRPSLAKHCPSPAGGCPPWAVRVTDDVLLQRPAEVLTEGGWAPTVADGSFTHDYSAPSAGPPLWYVYEFLPEDAYAVATKEPSGATRRTF